MRVLTLNISNEIKLDCFNSMFGQESIYYNDELVSEKRSMWGATHNFEIEEDGEIANYKIVYKHDDYGGIRVNIYRNNTVILLN